jgi:hypothetical protein
MTRKKRGEYEEPLSLNMDPDEALERFAQTDPAEADALAKEADAGQFADETHHDTGDRLLPYVGKSGAEVSLIITDNTFWASQGQMAEMFGIHRSQISRHIKKIISDGELSEEGNVRLTHISPTKPTKLYNLDMVIAVGYRVESKQGTLFRIWATDKLVQYLTKGFAIDAPRLKEPGEYDRVAELREIIRDIRAAEANVYAELRRICALCADYDKDTDAAREFYQRMQAKLYWAVVSHTPSMVLMDRADAEEPNMGLQSWPKADIRQADAVVAKNYLAGAELEELNRLTTILLDIFDDQLKIGKLTLMAEADALLDAQLKNLSRAVLTHGGSVSATAAKDHAKAEYKKFDERRRALRARERQAELLELKETAKALPKSKKK